MNIVQNCDTYISVILLEVWKGIWAMSVAMVKTVGGGGGECGKQSDTLIMKSDFKSYWMWNCRESHYIALFSEGSNP
jgi:hypothetical protein